GYDKKVDLSALAAASDELAALYTIGATGAALASASSRAIYCQTLERAVERAVNAMQSGDILLLSPGCASWDQFTNYEERGETFARLVAQATGYRRRMSERSRSS